MDSERITIAITVYDRRQYLQKAIASALDQTVPVRVIVVEDCGPDPMLESLVKAEFGSRIEYVRNPKRRGLFGNWNACLELCQTEWLSILHDDDFLAPNFTAEMVKLAGEAPGLDLYFGQTVIVNERSEPIPEYEIRPVPAPWMRIGLTDIIYHTPFPFPGQLFRVSSAKSLGGFCVHSYYCGDWEMWAKLIARTGAAQTGEVIAFNRLHAGLGRGSNRVFRSGRGTPASYLQHKRVLALLPPASRVKFDRAEYQRRNLIPVRFLLRYGASLSPRLLRYYVGLLLLSKPPHWGYAVFRGMTRIGGTCFVKVASALWNQINRQPPANSNQ
jgi:glycosyltransferase involved in cell wall biosynthesis